MLTENRDRWLEGILMVNCNEERMGFARGSRGMGEFDEFIRESELFDPYLRKLGWLGKIGMWLHVLVLLHK